MSVPENLRHGYRALVTTHLAVAAAALVLVGVLLLVFEFLTMRSNFVDDLRAHARTVAITSAPAIIFQDRFAAEETLAMLEPLPSFQAAAIFNSRSELVAEHGHPEQLQIEQLDASLRQCGHRFGLRTLYVAEPIVFEGQQIGTVVLRSGLERLYARVLLFALFLGLVSVGALAVTYPLISRMSLRIKSAEARLDHLAHFDPVTGLLNRNAFKTQMQRWLYQAGMSQQTLALLILDVDNFKIVNDSLGHQYGDQLLRQISGRLGDSVRAGDKVFRIGGDEFAVALFPIDGGEEAEQVARRLFEQFERPFLLDRQEWDAGVSGGMSLYPGDAGSLHELTRNADTAMYLAKRMGKGRFEIFRPELNELMQQRSRLTNDLRRAVERHELRLVYQPQAASVDLTVTGMEALLRWDHPELGAVGPTQFVPIAEESGVIVALGRWAIAESCQQLREWRRAGLAGVRMSINVSARQLRDEGLLSFIDATLVETGCSPEQLELEITESLLMENVEANIVLLKQLRERGIQLAIDDFGTGYSSMAYLHQLPIDRLKIDMSFIRKIPGDGEVIASAIIALAHRLGISVVAEGVETRAQLEYLRASGCDTIQGYWLAQPMPAALAGMWLNRTEPVPAMATGI